MMTKRKQVPQNPLVAEIETALRPGQFIDYRVEGSYRRSFHPTVRLTKG
jgi:hypothetical protein